MSTTPGDPGPHAATAALAGLAAHTVALPAGAPLDVYPAAAGGGIVHVTPSLALAGFGQAAVLPLPGGLDDPAAGDVGDLLGAVTVTDAVHRRGTGVLAFGALPFDRTRPAELVVPALVYGCDDRGAWATVVGPRPAAHEPPDPRAVAARLERLLAPHRGRPAPAVTSFTFEPPPGGYEAAVAGALEAIAAGELDKVVLSRAVTIASDAGPDPVAVLRRLHGHEPTCTTFAHPLAEGLFVGASPELLVGRRGDTVTCLPLAGTVGQGRHPDEDDRAAADLLTSAKDRAEHRLVVDYIAAVLAARCATLQVPPAPSLTRLHSVAHLATGITGTLAPGTGRPSVFDLVVDLHPTPAVGGVPMAAATAAIARLEEAGRGPWSGPVGWVDGRGDGEWMIGIRSALLHAGGATLRAGAGIVAGSDPAAELAETTVKLRPVVESLYPGAGEWLAGEAVAATPGS